MQEKKNKRLFILLVVLLTSTAAVYWFSRDNDNYEVDKNLFRDYDLKSIDEIVLESAAGRVALKYTGSRWKVNDQFSAEPAMIEVLFATLQQVEPKRPLPSSINDSIASDLQKRGIKVSMFTGGELQKVFYAGGNTSKNQAFFMDSNGETYLMTIPGYRVYASGIFELPENGWRDKFVFGFNWRNFQSLEVNFRQNPSDDFVVAMDNNYFGVKGLTEVDTTRLNDFLDDVSLLTVDEYVISPSSPDSLAAVDPIVTILVKDIAGKEYALKVFPQRDQHQPFPGLINGTQWALFQENKILGIVKRRNFFGK